ncbi:hypothetical protein MPSEU_000888500 [Mayamaea pseudoterrestris]|nr:hypothetical protein MPSEU_000888500 [Mayamaea pseudoterrestris]
MSDLNESDGEILPPPTPTMEEEMDVPPPRLAIQKMSLENFKSYAGLKEIGPFHKCFSSVVGPNGSGKSNVIDAMLFVFGKRAKKLRLNKVRELIHKSSAHANCESATVCVYFHKIIDTGEGAEDYRVVANSECVVSRTAFQNNSSTYKINGKTCQFKDVAAYLGANGIDLDNNRFLILQGEVEMISMMPPKAKNENDEGLLEYLEDIIGSNKYVEDTNKAMEQLEVLSEHRDEKLNRVKAVQKELEGLESAKLEAQALLAKEREIRCKQNILYQIESMSARTELDECRVILDELNQQLDGKREAVSLETSRLKEIEENMKPQQIAYDKTHAELKKTKDEFTAFERKDIKFKEEIKHAKDEIKKLKAKIVAETKNEETAAAKREEATESLPGLEAKIEQLSISKAEEDEKLETIHEETKGVTQQLRAELEVKTQELAPIQQERSKFQNKLDTAETKVRLLEDATTRAKAKLAEAETEVLSLDDKEKSTRSELATTQDELTESSNRIVDAENECKVLTEKEGKLSIKMKDLMIRSEQAKANAQSNKSIASKPVQAVLKAAEKNGPLSQVGILGRLGDLATIPAEYDVAVSTACGGKLNMIVVQTSAGATKILEFLRKNNLGRVTCIALDKLHKGAHDRQVETPEGAPRLFDLITPLNFSVTPAIYKCVGNTLVAEDIQTASRWAYDFGKRWRVVTADGKLIESSGTMSGGGASVSKGGMRIGNAASPSTGNQELDDISADCDRLEGEVQKCQQLLHDLRTQRKDLLDEIRQLKQRIKAYESKLPKLSMEIAGFDTTRTELTKLIPELKSQSKLSAGDEKELRELNKVVETCKDDMSSCVEEASRLQAAVDRLQKAILDAGGPKLKKQQEKCEKTLKALNDTQKLLNLARVAITSSEKAMAKASSAKASAESKLKETQTKLDEKKAERESLTGDAEAVLKQYEAVMALEKEQRQELDSIQEEIEVLQKSLSDAKSVELEFFAKIDDRKKQATECEKRLKHWTKSIENLRSAAQEDDEDDDLSDDEGDDDDIVSEKVSKDAMDVDEEVQCSTKDDSGGSAMDNLFDADAEVLGPTEMPDQPKSKTKNSLPTFSHAALEKYSKRKIKDDIEILTAEKSAMAKNANMGAIAEYKKKETDYLARVSDLEAVTEERNAVRKTHDDLRKMRLDMFMEGFSLITLKLKEMYQMITLGGDAELELVDSLDPFSEGIVFSVRPPKKSWKNISNLSGGEKTLSSLALVFALHHFKPTPLYVMDEIDAALDFKNVSIVANYIKERTKNAQFIIISLRNNMFELADRLVGIYKTDNCTKSVTIDPAKFGAAGEQNGFVPPMPALGEKTNKDSTQSNGGKSTVRHSLLSEGVNVS